MTGLAEADRRPDRISNQLDSCSLVVDVGHGEGPVRPARTRVGESSWRSITSCSVTQRRSLHTVVGLPCRLAGPWSGGPERRRHSRPDGTGTAGSTLGPWRIGDHRGTDGHQRSLGAKRNRRSSALQLTSWDDACERSDCGPEGQACRAGAAAGQQRTAIGTNTTAEKS
jgi:hypothetical protein